jgi:peroxiredoxin Q/BCP
MLKPGDKAPMFDLISGDGKSISLKDFKGKNVVLYFYPKDNTSGCTKEACSFQEHLDVLRRFDAVVIGVSGDSVESHARFAAKFGLRFSLLSDESKKVLKSYGVWKEKSLYGRKYMGIERTTYIIDEKGCISHIFPRVKVEGHVDAVVEALKGKGS